MGRLRFLFALWMAKLSVPALKITHHDGTDFPGSLACTDLSSVQFPQYPDRGLAACMLGLR